MTSRRRRRGGGINPHRMLQVGFVCLLAICAAQVVWWIYDEVNYTERIQAEILKHHSADIEAARMLLDCGIERDVVLETFDELSPTEDGGLTISPTVRADLQEERRARINRYVWEGGFFLLVLAAGVTVLTRAMQQDTELHRRQQNFVAAVSHELKSPVASMRLAAETLLIRDPAPEARRRIVGRLVQDIDRLETMVSNILDTARLEEGRLQLSPERLSLRRIVDSVVEEARSRVQEAGVEIAVAGPEDVEINIDEVALRSVLRNLVDNAIKASEPRADGRIELEVTREHGEAVLQIRDNGVGFAPEQSEAIFQKFYRPGDEMQRPSRGSGLGLYLVRRFVELYGGHIAAHSEGPGRGARFTIRWPAVENDA